MQNILGVNVNSEEEAASIVLDIVRQELEEGLEVIGLATGSTMIPIYSAWANSDLDFSKVSSFNLDEYVGLGKDHPNSFAWFMNHHLFNHKLFKETHIPDGTAENLMAECNKYEVMLREAEIDLQLLGVGENGHIAFNEPGTPFSSTTHVTKLSDTTIGVNSQYFGNEIEFPRTAMTMGINSILSAKKIILISMGEKKQLVLEQFMKGEQTTDIPVTALLHHPDVTVITDLDVIK